MNIINITVIKSDKNTRHNKCKGRTIDNGPGGIGYDCDYRVTFTCDDCRYCSDRTDKRTGKLPSAKKYQNG